MTLKVSIFACLDGKIKEGSTVLLQGWVKTKRESKAGVTFIHLSDGSCFNPLQVVAPESLANYATDIAKITTGCSLAVEGKLIKSLGKGQQFEIEAEQITVIGWIDNPDTYPIQAKRHTLEFLREVAHLRVRTNTIGAVTRIRHSLAQIIHQFFDNRGFYWITTPIITTSDCEGAGEMFRVSTLDLCNLPKTADQKIDYNKDFFGQEAFLTVSGQLNLESYCLAMSKVYTFGPTFRAENSNTSRHLAEFWMVEPEVAFANLDDIALLAQDMIQTIAQELLAKRPDDLAFFNQHIHPDCINRLEHLATTDFERITYTKAIELLQKAKQKFTFPVAFGLDLQSEHERYLCEEVFKKPLVVTDYPQEIKGFYMRLNEDNKTVAAMDILAPGIGEIIGGSEREDRLPIIEERMQKINLPIKNYNWYLDLRRYGSVPHAGFGLGFERLISYLTGLNNIRDVIPFPRTPGHAEF
ncbi:MAG: asparagine--tRNA ligase [Legionellales bacterium RIFCSPHIGHO2_12_FULL_37_14]|nr:MAG: asparagine--tRNA ligase [Legionellales bacterium RIFCSPHIGHO2_12_FULL_37_14]